MKSVIISISLAFLTLVSAPAGAKQLFTYDGVLDLRQGRLDVNVAVTAEETLRATLQRQDGQKYHLKADLSHFPALSFDVNSEMEGLVEVQSNPGGDVAAVIGTLWSNYSIIDGQPVKELSGGFRIEDGKLNLMQLSFGSVDINGMMGLQAPYKVGVNFDIHYMPMAAFLKFWTGRTKYDNSRGDVIGTIRASGPLDRVLLKGNLKSYQAEIQKNQFDSIVLNLEGHYPDIQIDKSSRLSKQDGVSFSIDGRIDLKDHRNFKRQLKKLHMSPLVKESTSLKEWTIKTQKEAGEDSAELEYFIRNEEKLGTNEEETTIIGIQRSLQF